MAVEKFFLVGMMGSGKSFWTQKMAKWIKAGGYDLDDLIEMHEEKTVAEIFNEDGEEYFRKTESKLLKWFKEKKKYVLATGGGTPCFHDNIQWMKKEGIVIWLDESIEVMVQRLQAQKETRPLIASMNPDEMHQFLSKTLADRTEFYAQAHFRLTGSQITEAHLKNIVQKNAI
jgi:shikimate kinase